MEHPCGIIEVGKNMIGRKYIVHVTGVGVSVILIIYATSCNPLPFSQITQIARQYVNPACEVASYNIEAPELPQNVQQPPLISYNTINGTAASGVSTTAVPYTNLR